MSIPLELLKKAASNRYCQLGIAFVLGGVITGIFLPEKTIIKKETEIVYKDKIVEKEVVKVVEKEVVKEVKVVEKVKVVKRKETFPDGHIVEEEVYESESEQIARIAEQEKKKYEEALCEMEKEYKKKESYLKEVTNPHKFSIYGGMGTQVDAFQKYFYLGGMQAQVWGPLLIGLEVTSHKDAALTLGIRF